MLWNPISSGLIAETSFFFFLQLYISPLHNYFTSWSFFSTPIYIMSVKNLPHFYTEEKVKPVSIISSCKHTCNLLYTQNKVKFIFGNFERVGWFKGCVICSHLIHIGYYVLLGWNWFMNAISIWWVCMDYTSQNGSWICAWLYSCWFLHGK